MKKTNAMRLLDQKKIYYEVVEYSVDKNDLSASTVANKLGQNSEQVFKTLVLRGDKTGVLVCVIPGNTEVNLKKAAKASSNKKVEMILMKELLGLTGYIRGGCTPIGMKKPYPLYIHKSATTFDFIFISAGQRGMQLKLDPSDLINFLQITTVDLI